MTSSPEPLKLPESRWVDVGGPVHYREWEGPRDGHTFLCVHGLGGSGLNWALVAPGLARRGRVIALDLAGFGLTRAIGRSATVGANWKLLDGFIRALSLPPVVLVGNSMGGMISLIQAAHAPETVRSLVLVDAVFPRTGSLEVEFRTSTALFFAIYNSPRLGVRVARRRARRLGPEGLVREALRVSAADPDGIDPRLVEALIEQAHARSSFDMTIDDFVTAARSIFQAQVRPAKYRALVASIQAPALVIHGERDLLVPASTTRAAAAGHGNWELIELDGIGHIAQIEAPERWLALVGEWLDRTYPSAALRSSDSDSSIA